MPRHHHLAHLESFMPDIQVGEVVQRGQLIGRVGKSGTTWAHCHYEATYEKPSSWTGYIYGKSLEWVESHYIDVDLYIDSPKMIPCKYTTYGGYEYLSPIQNKEGKVIGYHPGIDLNEGSGNDDLGNAMRSPVTGKVVYRGDDEGGWGNHLWIEEEEAETSSLDWCREHIPERNWDGTSENEAAGFKYLAERITEWIQ